MLKKIFVVLLSLILLLCGCTETHKGIIYDAELSPLAEGNEKNRTYTRSDLMHTLMGLENLYDDQLKSGEAIVTSIDPDIQDKLSAALDDLCQSNDIINYACGIVMEPKSGKVLAITSLPAFDINNKKSQQDKTVHITYAPGATFLPFAYAAAIENEIEIKGDFDAQIAGDAFVTIGGDKIESFIDDFGFGNKTALSLPGETHSALPQLDDETALHTLPTGLIHAVTPLQFISAFCALINEGTLYEPQIVTEHIDKNGKIVTSFDKSVAKEKIIKSQTCNKVIEFLNPSSSDVLLISDIVENPPRTNENYTASAIGCTLNVVCLVVIGETVTPDAQPLSAEPILQTVLESISK